MKPHPIHTAPRHPDPAIEIAADIAAQEHEKRERFDRMAENAENRRRDALPPPPPKQTPPKKIRLRRNVFIGGRAMNAGDVVGVIPAPVVPAGVILTKDALDLIGSGTAERAE
jgi:hypothetical protein